jgi:hypothetical protein
MANALETATLTLADTYTDALIIYGLFNVSISGTWGGTITLQRSFDNSTWRDVKTYTLSTEERGLEPEQNVYYRIGFKSDGAPTGTAVVRLAY